MADRQPSLRYFVHMWELKQPWISTASNPKRISSFAISLLGPRQPPDSPNYPLPVLLDVERPLELQMGLVVVVDEFGNGGVVATAEHARGSGFGFDCEVC